MNKGNILFIDNDKLFLDTRAIFLTRAGYRVFKAHTLEEAELNIKDHWIQLIIVDIRTVDDDDMTDKSGIDFARRPEYAQIPKIVLTGMKPDLKDIRNVLVPSPELGGQQIALTFLEKDEGAEEMISVIDGIFNDYIALNRQLTINWKEIGLLELLGKIETNLSVDEIGERLIELEGLLRTLFREYGAVTISQILIGTKSFPRMLAYTVNGVGMVKKYFVEIGKTKVIENRLNRFEQAIGQNGASAGSYTTKKSLFATTPRYGAIGWELSGFGACQYLVSFESMMSNHSVMAIGRIISQFLDNTLRMWHGPHHSSDESKVEALFLDHVLEEDSTTIRLNNMIEATKVASDKVGMGIFDITADGCLDFQIKLTNEDDFFFDPLANTVQLIAKNSNPISLRRGVVHGSLHVNTIFFNHEGRGWLTGFDRTELNQYLLIDYIRFAQDLRMHWSRRIKTGDWALVENGTLFPDSQDTIANESWLKMMVVLSSVQRAAISVDILSERVFWEGLFWANIQTLIGIDSDRLHGCDEIQQAINLLLSTLLIGRHILGDSAQSPQSLKIDQENQSVIIGGETIELTPQEHKLIAFLAKNANKAVSRSEIALEIFGENYDSSNPSDEYNRVNMITSRLRKKIEPIDESMQFISAVRGKGYRLNLKE